MSTLILTCDTGEGHNSCAKAIKEVYDANGVPCEIINPVEFVSARFARLVHRIHTAMYQKFPTLFKVGYRFTQDHSRLTTAKGSFPYWILSRGVDQLNEYIILHQIDRIICVHPLLMMMVTELQRRYHTECQVAFVATDYTCSPGVSDSHPDVCFIPDDSLAEDFVCENIRYSQLIASGIPVRQQFYQVTDKKAAKAQLGIAEDAPHLLMACGSMGCGPMEELLDALAVENPIHITVACGNNESLRHRLFEKYSGYHHIHILGFVQDMSELMDSADLFVTKPGGLSSTEAAVKGLPAVYLNAVGGCESYNLAFFVQRNGAVSADSTAHAAALCRDLLRDSDKLEQMRQALKKLRLPNAGKVIFASMNEIKK